MLPSSSDAKYQPWAPIRIWKEIRFSLCLSWFLLLHREEYVPSVVGREAAAAAAKLFQSCPALCNPTDGSPPGPIVPGILQARTLEWVAISFSNAEKWKVKVKTPSRVRLLATPWTAGYEAPPSMGFSRQEYWSGLPLPSSGEGGERPKFCLEVLRMLEQKNHGEWIHPLSHLPAWIWWRF